MKSPEVLQNSGRELAASLLTSAFETAQSPEQAANQICVLNAAAISILAHHVYNKYEQHKVEQIKSIDEVMASLRREMMLMNSATCDSELLVVTSS